MKLIRVAPLARALAPPFSAGNFRSVPIGWKTGMQKVQEKAVKIYGVSGVYEGGFLKWWGFPNNHGVFLLKIDHFGVEIGVYHQKKETPIW